MSTILETDRLLIKKITHDDIEGMYTLDSDPEVHRFLGNHPVLDKDESKRQIESIQLQYEQNGIARWAMIEKSSGDFIGWTGLKYMTELTNGHIHHYDLGYRLIRKYWGKGYATESAKASRDYGFKHLGIDTIYAMADLGNHASIHVLQKTGLQCRNIFDYKGVPHQWLDMTRDEWINTQGTKI